MSTSRLSSLKQIISSIPPTPLRPAGSPQLSNALQSIVGRIDSRSAPGSAAASDEVVARFESSLGRLQSGVALSDYPLSSRTLAPSHDPQYYTRIKDGVHLAAQGKGRSWWKSFFQLRGEA